MPLTYFAHQVFVLPFKSVRPRLFDGTALCIGSMAPDFAYAFVGTPLSFASHTPLSLVLWSLPVTCLLTVLTRVYLAQPLGAQLPNPLGCELQALARTSHRWPITVMSALLGAWSHIFVDGFTHRHGWGYEHFSVLHRALGPGWVVADLLQYFGHSFGSLLGALWFWRLCASHSVSTWNGSFSALHAQKQPAPQARWVRRALFAGVMVSALWVVVSLARGVSLPVAIIRASYLALCWLCAIAYPLRRARPLTL